MYLRSVFSTLSSINNQLFTKSRQDGDKDFIFAFFEPSLDVSFDFLQVFNFWEVAIFFHFTLIVKQLKSIFIETNKGIFLSLNKWSINHITGMECAIVDFISQDILSFQNNFGRTMLSGFGSGGF